MAVRVAAGGLVAVAVGTSPGMLADAPPEQPAAVKATPAAVVLDNFKNVRRDNFFMVFPCCFMDGLKKEIVNGKIG